MYMFNMKRRSNLPVKALIGALFQFKHVHSSQSYQQ